MPKANAELMNRGMLIVEPSSVLQAVSKRKPGYLEAFRELAVMQDGLYYIAPNNYEYIRTTFAFPEEETIESATQEIQTNVLDVVEPNQEALKSEQKALADKKHRIIAKINKFLSVDVELVADEKLLSLRQAYINELNNLKSGGCTNCQINGLKAKYRRILEQKLMHE